MRGGFYFIAERCTEIFHYSLFTIHFSLKQEKARGNYHGLFEFLFTASFMGCFIAAFRTYHNMPFGILTIGPGYHAVDFLHNSMNDSAFVRIHWFQRTDSAGTQRLVCNFAAKVL